MGRKGRLRQHLGQPVAAGFRRRGSSERGSFRPLAAMLRDRGEAVNLCQVS